MKRQNHNLSHYKLATMDMGQLVPVQVQEVLPGDSFRMQSSALIRVSPLVAPVMHPVEIRLHHWFVPNRLVWDAWEDFITGGPDNQNADTIPTVNNAADNGILDFMGVPPVAGTAVNALPVRAFNKIFNEFYRDQDLVTERTQDDLTIPKVSWKKDYFTSARPWQAKGVELRLPFSTDSIPIWSAGHDLNTKPTDGGNSNSPVGAGPYEWVDSTTGLPTIWADLTDATGITANEFREFFALQRYAEARAAYGSRYTEYLRYLGVRPSDARLQRPEYLGGGKSTLQFSEVLQTADDTTEGTPVGTLRGHGISALRSKGVRKFFEEHGYVITVMSVVPKSIYTDGCHRMWLRQNKEDFYQKELQNVGQQKVYQGEVYLSAGTETDTFGYQDRYADYCSTPSTVSGDFRTTLDFWHLGRKFAVAPALNSTFITCDPSKRVFASQATDSLWVMVNNKCAAKRLVKKTSIGSIL